MRLLLLEDEDYVARHIEFSIRSLVPDAVIVRKSDVEEALKCALESSFDCLLFDRMVDGGDGLQVLREVRRRGVETPAIIISNLNDLDHRVEGLDTGADDYIGKIFQPEELIARIRAAMRRARTQGHPRIIKLNELELHRVAGTAFWNGTKLPLKPKEFALLLCLTGTHPLPASYDLIWSEVWPMFSQLPPQKQPIHTTISRLRLALQNAPEVSIQSTAAGYCLSLRSPGPN